MRPRFLYLFGAALLVGAAWFIWPTPYREYRLGPRVIRVHRLTGKTERLFESGWEPVQPKSN